VTQCFLFSVNEAYLIISANYTRCLPNMVGAVVVIQRVPEIARPLRQKPLCSPPWVEGKPAQRFLLNISYAL